MAYIIGVKIRQNEIFEKEVEGKKQVIEINKLELRVTTEDTAPNSVGFNVGKYTIPIDDIKFIFGIKEVPELESFAKSILDRECFFETRAKSGFNGSVSDEVVRVKFLDDILKANQKQSASK